MAALMKIFDGVSFITMANRVSAPALLFPSESNDDKSELVEGFFNIPSITLQFICCAISAYACYINLKCHCGNVWEFWIYGWLIMCCPLCTVPYLFHKHFINKCG